MQLINATPHEVKIHATRTRTGEFSLHEVVALPAGELVLRCQEQRNHAGEFYMDGVSITLSRLECGAVTAVQGGSEVPVPEPQDGVVYVVSALVRLASPHRTDFLSPGPLIRDEDGNVIGCQGLTRT